MENLNSRSVALEFCLISPLLLILYLQTVLRGIGKAYVESLNSRSVLPPDPPPPYGSNWGPSFIVDFIPSDCIKRYWHM